MARRKAFTVVEMLLAVAVIGVLFGLIFAFYRSAIEKSKYVEAVATVDTISKAEEIKQMNTGEYVAAANTQEVNERLGLDINPRWYNYKVIGVTDDNFIVLAEKILDDINSGNLSSEPIVIARDRSGPVSPESIGPSGTTDIPFPEDLPTSSSSPPSGGPGGGDTPTGGTTPTTTAGSQTGGGGSRQVLHPTQTGVPTALLDLLKDTVSGDWAYDLIHNNFISVVYVDPDDYGISGALAWWAGINDQTWYDGRNYIFVTGNTIFLNKDMLSWGYTEAAIASVIAHESNHADYQYHGQTWIDATKAAHPELTDSDIHISPTPNYNLGDSQNQYYPFNSIDQEYQGFNDAVDVWNEIKGTDTNAELDYWAALKATGGEAAMKTEIRARYGVNPPEANGLPEY